jgi:hypothetical protein
MQLSNLINAVPPYHFADTAQKIAARRAAGVDVIGLSLGAPDLPAPQAVFDRLCAAMHVNPNMKLALLPEIPWQGNRSRAAHLQKNYWTFVRIMGA